MADKLVVDCGGDPYYETQMVVDGEDEFGRDILREVEVLVIPTVEIREEAFTEEELARQEPDASEVAARRDAEAARVRAREAARASAVAKLKRLGLTDEEIEALR